MPRFDVNDYVTVQERIVRFWSENPDGAIRTQLESPSDNFDICRYSASVFINRDDLTPAAVGWAFEKVAPAGDKGPNATSHEENCETSAIGRALANLGYATSQKDRPSREEMGKVATHEAGETQASQRPTQLAQRPPQDRQDTPQERPGPASDLALTDRQRGLIQALAREQRLTVRQVNELCMERTGSEFADLTRQGASTVIETLKAAQPAQPEAMA